MINQSLKIFSIIMCKSSGWRLIRRTLSCNHVGRNSPWSSAKPDQGRIITELPFHQTHRFIDRRYDPLIKPVAQSRKCCRIDKWFKPWPFSCEKFNLSTKCEGYNKNIGKQDCGVKTKPPHWL